MKLRGIKTAESVMLRTVSLRAGYESMLFLSINTIKQSSGRCDRCGSKEEPETPLFICASLPVIFSELQVQVMDHEAAGREVADSSKQRNGGASTQSRSLKWWLLVSIYSLFLLAGQSVATLLGRLYYDKGGSSKWMATLVLPAGFPVLIPFYFFSPAKWTEGASSSYAASLLVLSSVYFFLGILQAGCSVLYSIGLLYLPVSTYSLICATQLAFNAFFAFFFNSQKFTPFIINSLVLLTISATLLVFQNEQTDSSKISKVKYAVGFICTLAASASYGLMLSLTQLCFEKVLKNETFKAVLDMIVYQSLVATCAVLVGLFASGEWKGLRTEMEEFELGQVSYVMTLVWTAIAWQVFSIGAVGLIFEVSSLFSNVISTLGFPVVPVLAVMIFHDKMNGVKVISMVLAIWGFVSYVYQHYLDDQKSKRQENEMLIPNNQVRENHQEMLA